ncbi:MAG TPA: putative ABC exporter domain-containing protein [Planctomycetota bacterium]|nr:putative ABC exporter domain-containing protein [Planctomycetota bacterium]
MHPALRRLAWLRLRGLLRRQRRRLRRPTGWLLALAGLAMVALWILMLVWSPVRGGAGALSPERLELLVRCAALVLLAMTVLGAFNHRGLYMPAEEIERLFAAPVSRSDLVRYRLLVGFARSALGALVLGLVALRRLPSPLLGMLGVFLAAQTLPVVGQTVSVLLGDAENRAQRFLTKRPLAFARVLTLALVIVVVLTLLVFLILDNGEGVGPLPRMHLPGGLLALLDQPWLARATLPLAPWSAMVTAPDLAGFLAPFGFCALVYWGLTRLVSGLRVDYRELSLSTSADVARRIQRARKVGGVASGSRASRGSLGARVPWLFGRGPSGAVAWRKTCSILRKARGTVVTSVLIVGGLTFAAVQIDRGADDGGLGGSLLIGGVGTFYLCAGLRFDFREDLDRMESILSWPVRPWRVFLATLVPEVVLVSGLLVAAILLRRLPAGSVEPATWMVACAVPVTTLVWVAIDNAVFLFAPVRMTPGQEGALQHIGRQIALLAVRMVGLALALAGAGAALASHLLLLELGWGELRAAAVATTLFALVVTAEVVGLIALGGRLLARFDLARDRG